MQLGSFLDSEINGLTADTGYSQLDVAGTASFSGVNLVLIGSLASFNTDTLTLIEASGASAASMSFVQTSCELNGIWYTMSYAGGESDVTVSAGNIVTFDGELIIN